MIYVLIPCHNNKDEVLALLSCLGRQTVRELEIVLVDDGSTDGTEERVGQDYPHVNVVKGNGELWWTGATELGVSYILLRAKGDDFVLLLNNDVTVSEDYVEQLLSVTATHKHALIGSMLIDCHDPEFMEGGIRANERLYLFPNRNKFLLENEPWDTNVDVLPGRGTLIPVEVFRRIGNFNRKKLPHYGADYEFSMRAKRAGFPLVVSHRARVFANLNITGLQSPTGLISTIQCCRLLFSKKSKGNVIYYLNYVWLCSTPRFKLPNTLFALKGILANTLLKTPAGYFARLLLYLVCAPFFVAVAVLRTFRLAPRAARKVYSFCMAGYPLRLSDIDSAGVSAAELVEKGILQEVDFRGHKYWTLCKGNDHDEFVKEGRAGAAIEPLRKQSLSYLHKVAIDWEKTKILFRK
jgi:GT2 family glycosyltransferase